MADYELRLSKPMDTIPYGHTVVDRIAIKAENDEEAYRQALDIRPEHSAAGHHAYLWSADDSRYWVIQNA